MAVVSVAQLGVTLLSAHSSRPWQDAVPCRQLDGGPQSLTGWCQETALRASHNKQLMFTRAIKI